MQIQLHRGRLIDHIHLVVSDLEASRAFYTAILAVLDIPVMGTANDHFWADELFISSVKSPAAQGILTGRHHLAFQAKNREMVNAFYLAALAHGGKCNGKPDERAYHPGIMQLMYLILMVTILKLSFMAKRHAVRHQLLLIFNALSSTDQRFPLRITLLTARQ
ncbi:VOC family protein [Acinetobacter towneri]|uniref:VOC family protein n=1 Tax=Acinetobacter towneri TaxID=202956 RepID=UPI002936D418|nr:VOC family protein [Acinetobacter towneri]MDV2454702.1 VOC family protein [Acinetobacter towneri]